MARPTFISALVYRDNRTAITWLQRAFGFGPGEVLVDEQDNIVHAEITFGDGVLMIGNEWTDWTKSPASLGGANTQRIFVQLQSDIDGHCARARAAGAQILMEPADQFYGERSYIAVDLEGHHWTFSQTIKQVSHAELEQAGFKYKKL